MDGAVKWIDVAVFVVDNEVRKFLVCIVVSAVFVGHQGGLGDLDGLLDKPNRREVGRVGEEEAQERQSFTVADQVHQF